MRSSWIKHDDIALALRLLTPANSLAVELALCTGLRISDVLGIRAPDIRLSLDSKIYVLERKTKKVKRITIPKKLLPRLDEQSGDYYVFASPLNPEKPRTRQAVWKDLKRAAKALRIKDNMSPHSARKIYAVQMYKEHGLKATQKALNHTDLSTTLIYLMSELL